MLSMNSTTSKSTGRKIASRGGNYFSGYPAELTTGWKIMSAGVCTSCYRNASDRQRCPGWTRGLNHWIQLPQHVGSVIIDALRSHPMSIAVSAARARQGLWSRTVQLGLCPPMPADFRLWCRRAPVHGREPRRGQDRRSHREEGALTSGTRHASSNEPRNATVAVGCAIGGLCHLRGEPAPAVRQP